MFCNIFSNDQAAVPNTAPAPAVMLYECLQREYVLIRENNHPFEDAMPRMGVYNELVQEFGARIRNFPQSPQLFWTEFKKCLTTTDSYTVIQGGGGGERADAREPAAVSMGRAAANLPQQYVACGAARCL